MCGRGEQEEHAFAADFIHYVAGGTDGQETLEVACEGASQSPVLQSENELAWQCASETMEPWTFSVLKVAQ